MNTTKSFYKTRQAKETLAMTKEELERLARIEQCLARFESKLNNHLDSEDELMPRLEVLLDTFVEAKGVIKFIKICSVVSASLAGSYLFIKELLTQLK